MKSKPRLTLGTASKPKKLTPRNYGAFLKNVAKVFKEHTVEGIIRNGVREP